MKDKTDLRFPFQLPSDKQFDCLGFGENTCDYLLIAPAFPVPDSKTALIKDVQTSGGQVASAIVGLARLGLKTAYAGRFGGDAAGGRGRESLIIENIDVSFTETIFDARTHTSYILIDRTTTTRTILFTRDERLHYAEHEAPLRAASLARILHLDAQNARAARQLAQTARANATIVSADFDFMNEDVRALLPHVDVLIGARDFTFQATSVVDIRHALAQLQSVYGCAIVGATLGTQGAIVRLDNRFIETAALPVPEDLCDTTGAGDAFHAGFLYGLLNDESIEDSLKIAAAVAALACRKPGARDGLPTKQELEDYLRSVSI